MNKFCFVYNSEMKKMSWNDFKVKHILCCASHKYKKIIYRDIYQTTKHDGWMVTSERILS
jgi:hypothetical protein